MADTDTASVIRLPDTNNLPFSNAIRIIIKTTYYLSVSSFAEEALFSACMHNRVPV